MKKKTKIGIVGCGAIGSGVAAFIDKKLKGAAVLSDLADLDRVAAEKLRSTLKSKPKITDIDNLIKNVDLVVETAGAVAAKLILRKCIQYKKDVVILSVGALVDSPSFIMQAKRAGIAVHLPSGAICGVDGLRALKLGTIQKITLITRKPPKGLAGADYLVKNNIRLDKLKKEKVVFRGTVKQAITAFPKNINVAATLLLASAFPKVEVCIIADPNVKRNIHHIDAIAKEARISIEVENIPSKDNPKTSTMAILSTQHVLDEIFSSFKIGS